MSDIIETSIDDAPGSAVVIIESKFLQYRTQAKEYLLKLKALSEETSEPTVSEIAVISEGRKCLKSLRCAVENRRKELKADIVERGRAIDTAANELKGMIEPVEQRLLAREEFMERKEKAAKEQRRADRTAELGQFGNAYEFGDLGEMSEAAYQTVLAAQKEAFKKSEALKVQLEKERIAREEAERKENERIRAENERLRAKQEESERKARKEREARLEAERKLEADRKAQQEAQEAKEAEERAAKRKAARAPDKEKLEQILHSIHDDLCIPNMRSEEGKRIVELVKGDLDKICAYLRHTIEEF
jgi:hypothetical protein